MHRFLQHHHQLSVSRGKMWEAIQCMRQRCQHGRQSWTIFRLFAIKKWREKIRKMRRTSLARRWLYFFQIMNKWVDIKVKGRSTLILQPPNIMASDRLSVFVTATELAIRAFFFFSIFFPKSWIMSDYHRCRHWSLLHHQVWTTLWNLPPTLHQRPQKNILNKNKIVLLLSNFTNGGARKPSEGRSVAEGCVVLRRVRPLQLCTLATKNVIFLFVCV